MHVFKLIFGFFFPQSCYSSSLYRSITGVGGMGGNAPSGTYGLPYMTGSPTELTTSTQQLWTSQGKFRFFDESYETFYPSFLFRDVAQHSKINYFLFFAIFLNAGLGGGLPPLTEDYGNTKSLPNVTQALPAFSQPFGRSTGFRNYSPPYSSQQSGAGTPGNPGADATSWSYPSQVSEALSSAPYTVVVPSRRPTSNSASQHQISAAASLSARK